MKKVEMGWKERTNNMFFDKHISDDNNKYSYMVLQIHSNNGNSVFSVPFTVNTDPVSCLILMSLLLNFEQLFDCHVTTDSDEFLFRN